MSEISTEITKLKKLYLSTSLESDRSALYARMEDVYADCNLGLAPDLTGTLFRMEDVYADCNGHDFFFRGKIILLFWDLIEEGDVFTDDDRLAITNLLLTLTRHASQEHHGWHCHEPCPEDRLMQNHASHAALTFFWGARYFKKYYGITEFDELFPCVDSFFEMCFRSSVNLDEDI